MKRNFLKLILISLSSLALTPAFATPKEYTLDPDHSYVEYHISHFGFSNPSGKWMVEGKLLLDEDKPQNSKVEATINLDTVLTGVPELNKHLKTDAFFDTKKFPKATFVSTKIIRAGKENTLIQGTLNVHGVSKLLTLKAKLNKKGINPINNKLTYGFSATTTLRRSDFGIITLLPGLGNDVKLNIEVEAH
jgi:polyisoprenoid-binding protein YceI